MLAFTAQRDPYPFRSCRFGCGQSMLDDMTALQWIADASQLGVDFSNRWLT
jgi:hypothetical protein